MPRDTAKLPHERRFGDTRSMRSVNLSLALLLVAASGSAADPTAPPASASRPPPAATFNVSPLLVFDVPPLPPPSLRLEAARIAGQRADLDWRYPEPGPLFGSDSGLWFVGYGRYRPRTARSSALHGGSIGATLIGQILLQADSPLAGVGALLTGATLDSAAADVDRDAESRRPTSR